MVAAPPGHSSRDDDPAGPEPPPDAPPVDG
jgi:hypothetical protein